MTVLALRCCYVVAGAARLLFCRLRHSDRHFEQDSCNAGVEDSIIWQMRSGALLLYVCAIVVSSMQSVCHSVEQW
jgi:hypothetical protein